MFFQMSVHCTMDGQFVDTTTDMYTPRMVTGQLWM